MCGIACSEGNCTAVAPALCCLINISTLTPISVVFCILMVSFSDGLQSQGSFSLCLSSILTETTRNIAGCNIQCFSFRLVSFKHGGFLVWENLEQHTTLARMRTHQNQHAHCALKKPLQRRNAQHLGSSRTTTPHSSISSVQPASSCLCLLFLLGRVCFLFCCRLQDSSRITTMIK